MRKWFLLFLVKDTRKQACCCTVIEAAFQRSCVTLQQVEHSQGTTCPIRNTSPPGMTPWLCLLLAPSQLALELELPLSLNLLQKQFFPS